MDTPRIDPRYAQLDALALELRFAAEQRPARKRRTRMVGSLLVAPPGIRCECGCGVSLAGVRAWHLQREGERPSWIGETCFTPRWQ